MELYEKKYKEALERMKSWAKGEHPECFTEAHKAAEFIFPELKESKESEDEKIRKELIDYFKENNAALAFKGISNECVIAWLEKQGKNIRLPKFTFDDILALQCCMETTKKVQEDKELYEQLQSLHDRLHDAYWLEKQNSNIDNANKEWDEEIEKNVNFLCELLTDLQVKSTENEIKHGTNSRSEYYYNIKKWLKSLRPQPKQEWSEEDERLFQIVIDILDRENHLGNLSHTDLIACVRKLKSLRPSSQWKPTEEQIRRLEYFLKLWGKTDDTENTKVFETVKSLLNDLKQLKDV